MLRLLICCLLLLILVSCDSTRRSYGIRSSQWIKLKKEHTSAADFENQEGLQSKKSLSSTQLPPLLFKPASSFRIKANHRAPTRIEIKKPSTQSGPKKHVNKKPKKKIRRWFGPLSLLFSVLSALMLLCSATFLIPGIFSLLGAISFAAAAVHVKKNRLFALPAIIAWAGLAVAVLLLGLLFILLLVFIVFWISRGEPLFI